MDEQTEQHTTDTDARTKVDKVDWLQTLINVYKQTYKQRTLKDRHAQIDNRQRHTQTTDTDARTQLDKMT